MEQFSLKMPLDGTWRLYRKENRNCADWADQVTTEAELTMRNLGALDCTVPGNFELDMQRAGLLPDLFFDCNTLLAQQLENLHLWYAVDFECNDSSPSAFLRFEGVDTVADYYLNGQPIGNSKNMLIAHDLPVGKALKKGKNELFVHIKPTVLEAQKVQYGAACSGALRHIWGALGIRKAASAFGWDILPRIVSGGIWRSVYLCEKKKNCIDTIYLYNANKAENPLQHLFYTVTVSGDYIREYSLHIKMQCKDSVYEHTHPLWHTQGCHGFYIDNPHLWWPHTMGEANLYDVTVQLLHGENVCDTRTFRHGLRTVELIRTDYIDDNDEGDFRFKINGKDFFVLGTNWVPLDAFHSRDKQQLPKALKLLKESGCNAVRCWGGNVYEDEGLFDFCDENGICIWQDFAMGCGAYPQNEDFCRQLADEAAAVIQKYRQHASLILWAGDNENDTFASGLRDPNYNVLTRRVIPDVLNEHDPFREYLPSSPYISPKAYADGKTNRLSEDHLWGPRRYYKDDFYKNAVCRFASETGYHGCNSVQSIRKFIAEENLWHWENNKAWLVHASCMDPTPGKEYTYRIPLMANQVKVLFGDSVPNTLDDFSLASQVSQGEAFKFFIERFRFNKGKMTGIIWWNLLDGWPQFSDAVVDYYGDRKWAFHVIKRCQSPVFTVLGEADNGKHTAVAVNERLEKRNLSYKITDLQSKRILLEGTCVLPPNSRTELGSITDEQKQRLLLIEGCSDEGQFKSHYLCGQPPFDYKSVISWLQNAGLL